MTCTLKLLFLLQNGHFYIFVAYISNKLTFILIHGVLNDYIESLTVYPIALTDVNSSPNFFVPMMQIVSSRIALKITLLTHMVGT